MQLELIGCTSAGKSTLSRSILQACHERGIDAFLGDDFVLEQFRLNWTKGHLPRRLLGDVAALFACLVTWRKNSAFYRFASRLLLALPAGRLVKLNLLRNVLRKIGIHEVIRFRSTEQQVIVVDEGVLQAAHNLFVHPSFQSKPEDLATFARLIPLPDAIVYLRQPESLLVDRTMERGHKRIPDRSYGNVFSFISQAVATFEELVQNPAVESKLLVVDGGRTVRIAARRQDDPLLHFASKIIRNGMSTGAHDGASVDP